MANDRFVHPREAARILGVQRRTLARWAATGKIKAIRPHGPTGHNRYDVASVLVQSAPDNEQSPVDASDASDASGTATPTLNDGPSLRVDAIYGRVSTRKQLNSLKRQTDDLSAKYPGCTVFSDCASGINFKRKGLKALLELAFTGRLRVLHIAHRDRLCRFAYDLVEYILKRHGATIRVEQCNDDTSPEHDLADDVIAVLTVFGARLHGRRSRKRQSRSQLDTSSQEGTEVSEGVGDVDTIGATVTDTPA